MNMVQTPVIMPKGRSMLPQNGVAEDSLQCSFTPPVPTASTSPPQPCRSVTTFGAFNYNSGASKPRPSALEILSMGGIATTNHRNNSKDDDDDVEGSGGSPPGTPDSQDTLVSDGRNDVLDAETKGLIKRFLTDFTGLTTASWNESKAHSTMRRVVAKVLEKHKYKYNGVWLFLFLIFFRDVSYLLGGHLLHSQPGNVYVLRYYSNILFPRLAPVKNFTGVSNKNVYNSQATIIVLTY